MKFQTKGRVTKDQFGNPMLDFDKVKYRQALKELKEGSYVLITISDQRSVEQNAKLYALLSEISSYTGESVDDLKAFFKHKFIGYTEHEAYDYVEECDEAGCFPVPVKTYVRELRSTTALSKSEFVDFINQIVVWAWENLSLNLNNLPEYE